MKRNTILVVDDKEALAMFTEITNAGFECLWARSLQEAEGMIQRTQKELIYGAIIDLNFPRIYGGNIELLGQVIISILQEKGITNIVACTDMTSDFLSGDELAESLGITCPLIMEKDVSLAISKLKETFENLNPALTM